MNKLVNIGTAAAALGVSTSTLRRWERIGKLVPARTEGGQRRYDLGELRPGRQHGAQDQVRSIAYARVASPKQQSALARQKQALASYCAGQGWACDVIADMGSGLNYQNQGLRRLLDTILAGHVGRLVLTHQDRLLRFGAELVFAVCEAREVEVVIINRGAAGLADSTSDEELAGDVLDMVTTLSARLYGARSRKNQTLIDGVRTAVADAQRAR